MESNAPVVPVETKAGPQIVYFGAEVISAYGAKVEYGEACVVEAELGRDTAVESLSVHCRERLYESGPTPSVGTRGFEARYEELRANDDTFRYALVYERRGAAAGEGPRVELNSRKNRAKLAGRVTFSQPESMSTQTSDDHSTSPEFSRRHVAWRYLRKSASDHDRLWTLRRRTDAMPSVALLATRCRIGTRR